MIKINLAATLGALNDVSKLMLEESAAYAISCGESEVLPAHLLLKSLENPFSDVRFILNKLRYFIFLYRNLLQLFLLFRNR